MSISASKTLFSDSNSHLESHVTVRASDVATLITFIDEEDREQLGNGLAPCFRRIFLSDGMTSQGIGFKMDAPTSFIVQPPLEGEPFAAWLWYENETTATYQTGIVPENSIEGDSEAQMREILEIYAGTLAADGLTLADDSLRTWIFVRDIDDNYAGAVKARREFFERAGLTPQTHYIASTGIAGSVADDRVKVIMDACSALSDGSPQQGGCLRSPGRPEVRYLHAPEHLNPTHEYGVTFERGTELRYGNFSRILISGTASIDNRGEVLHIGDAAKQCERMLLNIDALLKDAGAVMDDIASALVYIREVSDAPAVRKVLERRLPQLNYILLLAPVCRPAWLVEMECVALKSLK